MKDTLLPGIESELRFCIPCTKTPSALYPESAEFCEMPDVFATGFLVGFLEWACMRAISPHLDPTNEVTVGTHINVTHSAVTPPGLEAVAKVKLIRVVGRKLVFEVEAYDGVELISTGMHERVVINREKLAAKVKAKLASLDS